MCNLIYENTLLFCLRPIKNYKAITYEHDKESQGNVKRNNDLCQNVIFQINISQSFFVNTCSYVLNAWERNFVL